MYSHVNEKCTKIITEEGKKKYILKTHTETIISKRIFWNNLCQLELNHILIYVRNT